MALRFGARIEFVDQSFFECRLEIGRVHPVDGIIVMDDEAVGVSGVMGPDRLNGQLDGLQRIIITN